jgi:hypothetical protein
MHFKFASLFLALFVTTCLPSAAQTGSTVWRIGIFDRSSAEFAENAPQQPVTFVIDKDHPEKNWPGYAPALFTTGKPDRAATPRTIQFSLPAKPTAAYRLRVSLLIEHSRVPALRASINGHTGTFYLYPELDYSMGDTMAAFLCYVPGEQQDNTAHIEEDKQTLREEGAASRRWKAIPACRTLFTNAMIDSVTAQRPSPHHVPLPLHFRPRHASTVRIAAAGPAKIPMEASPLPVQSPHNPCN